MIENDHSSILFVDFEPTDHMHQLNDQQES